MRGKRYDCIETFGDMLGYKCESTVSKIENGRFSVSIDNLEKLLDKINSKLEILDKK